MIPKTTILINYLIKDDVYETNLIIDTNRTLRDFKSAAVSIMETGNLQRSLFKRPILNASNHELLRHT